jgi:hypothetical protein
MKRRALALRWVLVAAAAVTVAAFVNVVLVRSTQEGDDRVGRLRPLLIGLTSPAETVPPATTDRPADTRPATTEEPSPATTAEAPTTTDDDGSGREPGGDSSGSGSGKDDDDDDDDDDSGRGGGGEDDDVDDD